MSIRNRVMLATLGLATLAFPMTVEAQDDKVLIVRDGSVEIYTNNSSFHERDNDRKQKWSKKANTVQVFRDAIGAEPCTSELDDSRPVKFREVAITFRQQGSTDNLSITVANEGAIFGKLKFLMPDQWRFVFRQYKHRLVYGGQTTHEERTVNLYQVVVTPEDNTRKPTTYSSAEKTRLCVRFVDN